MVGPDAVHETLVLVDDDWTASLGSSSIRWIGSLRASFTNTALTMRFKKAYVPRGFSKSGQRFESSRVTASPQKFI